MSYKYELDKQDGGDCFLPLDNATLCSTYFAHFLSVCVCVCVCVYIHSPYIYGGGGCRYVMSNSSTPWPVAHQAPLSMEFFRQEYWSELPFPSPGNLHDPGIKPRSPAWQGGFLTTKPPWKPDKYKAHNKTV